MDLHSYLFSKTHSTFHYETTKAQILKRAFSFLLILILTQSCTLWLWDLTVVLEQSKCWSSFDRHVLSYTSSERCYNSQLLFRNIERKLLHPLPFLCSFSFFNSSPLCLSSSLLPVTVSACLSCSPSPVILSPSFLALLPIRLFFFCVSAVVFRVCLSAWLKQIVEKAPLG